MTAAPSAPVAVVAGGGGGLGVAIGRRLARAGYALALVDRDPAALDRAESALRADGGAAPLCIVADLTRARAVDRALGAAATLGPLALWVGATGTMHADSALAVPAGVWRRLIDANLTALFLGAQRAARRMRSAGRGGAIVLVGSTAADDARSPVGVAYGAAKAAVPYLVRRLAYECAPFGVRVNAVVPGVIHTPMHAALAPDALAALTARIALGRMGQPEEVAEAVAFFAGEASAYITGACLTVAGGRDL